MAQYILKLSFDLRQVTQSLAYEFIQGNADYPIEGDGPLAGTFNFQEGDEITVQVVATSATEPKGTGPSVLEGFGVNNCTFVSIPARMTEDLSMFDDGSSCQSLDNHEAWAEIQRETLPNNTQRQSRMSETPLKVTTKNGQWKISGYLSVNLSPEDAAPFNQLYFFDPEGSTGTGGGFGP